MTLLAKATERAPMNVICAVTTDATSRKADSSIGRFLVTRMAVETLVRPIKIKFRSFIMIKVPFTPIARIVTLLA